MIEHTNNIDIGQVEVVYNVESYAPRRHFFGAGSQFWCIFGRMTLMYAYHLDLFNVLIAMG